MNYLYHNYKFRLENLVGDNQTETIGKHTKLRIETVAIHTFIRFPILLWNYCKFVFFNVIGLFKKKVAILCSKVTIWLINSSFQEAQNFQFL